MVVISRGVGMRGILLINILEKVGFFFVDFMYFVGWGWFFKRLSVLVIKDFRGFVGEVFWVGDFFI